MVGNKPRADTALHRYAPVVAPRLRETGSTHERSTTPDQILQQLDDVIGVWEENPDFGMGPAVTLEKVKATRTELDTRIMDVQATNRTLTKQIDDCDDCAKLGNEYVVRARKAIQGYFGPDSTQYAQVGGTRASDRKSGGRREGRDGARGSIRWDDRHGRLVLPIRGTRGACRADIGRGRGAAARRRAVVERRHPVGRGGVLSPQQRPTVAQNGRCQGGILLPGDLSVTRELSEQKGQFMKKAKSAAGDDLRPEYCR
ncbi:MAG: hypothetical protein ACREX9_14685, partial [Gammaproteobacteria bacterium]